MSSNLRRSGFTLIEMLVVMAVIALLLSIAAPRFIPKVDQAREVTLRHNLAGLRQAIDQYYADKGAYPTALQDLVDQRYLRTVPVDPMTERVDTWVKSSQAGSKDETWFDVHSGATGIGSDGTSYATW
jgi:general secretion pathway protein G